MRFPDQKKRVHTAFDKFADLAILLFEVVFGTRQQQRASGLGELTLQGLNGACEVAVRKRGEYGANRAGTLCREGPCGAVGHPSEMPDHRSDPGSKLFRNRIRAVHGPGNGGGRYARDACYVAKAHTSCRRTLRGFRPHFFARCGQLVCPSSEWLNPYCSR